MTHTRVSCPVNAPIEEVFDCVAHIENFRAAIPQIVEVEFIGATERGVGTRFRETRMMRGRAATTELEVTEYEPPSRVRLVSDSGGAIWDTLFSLIDRGESTTLTMRMDARAHTFVARLTVPLFGRLVARAVQADMEAVRDHCESR